MAETGVQHRPSLEETFQKASQGDGPQQGTNSENHCDVSIHSPATHLLSMMEFEFKCVHCWSNQRCPFNRHLQPNSSPTFLAPGLQGKSFGIGIEWEQQNTKNFASAANGVETIAVSRGRPPPKPFPCH